MVADTHEKLIEMAERIGLDLNWIQNEGQWNEHFDLNANKRALAIRHGAQEVSQRQLVQIMRGRHPYAAADE